MKPGAIKYLLFLLLIVTVGILHAQPPAGYSVTALAKDPQGNVAKNRTVYVKGAIIKGAAIGGTTVYEETHEVQTNSDGLFTIIVGQGNRTSTSPLNSIALIAWGDGPYFYNYKLAVAPSIPASWWVPANNYIDMSTTQLWSVPYALYAGNASITNVTTGIKAGPPNTFLITDSSGNVSWQTPQAAQVNVTQISNFNLNLSITSGQAVDIDPNTTQLVKIYVPGVKKGDPVLIASQGDYVQWSVYNVWVGAPDTVSVRFANYTDTSVNVQGSQYKIVVIK